MSCELLFCDTRSKNGEDRTPVRYRRNAVMRQGETRDAPIGQYAKVSAKNLRAEARARPGLPAVHVIIAPRPALARNLFAIGSQSRPTPGSFGRGGRIGGRIGLARGRVGRR